MNTTSIAPTPAPQPRRLCRWKFQIEHGIFNQRTELFTTLDEALLDCPSWDRIGIVPSGHPELKPNRTDSVTGSPLQASYSWLSWTVIRDWRSERDPSPFITQLGSFGQPHDAFAFAEMKTEQAKKQRDTGMTFYVCLWAKSEDYRQKEIARLPADHLTALYRARDRAERRKERQRLAA
jgi:hypothetical protein